MSARYDRGISAWLTWCQTHGIDPWPKDPVEADAQVADWLYWRHTALDNGLARLRDLSQAIAHGCSARSLAIL